jgi:hypothetical protein
MQNGVIPQWDLVVRSQREPQMFATFCQQHDEMGRAKIKAEGWSFTKIFKNTSRGRTKVSKNLKKNREVKENDEEPEEEEEETIMSQEKEEDEFLEQYATRNQVRKKPNTRSRTPQVRLETFCETPGPSKKKPKQEQADPYMA